MTKTLKEMTRSEMALFKKGEERIEMYISIINRLNGKPLKNDPSEFIRIFSRHFSTIDEITRKNFNEIQESIIKEIEVLES